MSFFTPLRRLGVSLGLSLGLLASGSAAAAKCPNLGILLDRSGSMLYRIQDNNFATGTELSRWDIASGAVTALLNQYDGLLPIGLAVFPTDSVCTTGSFVVDPAYNTKLDITSRLAGFKPPNIDPDTPTCSAIDTLRCERLQRCQPIAVHPAGHRRRSLLSQHHLRRRRPGGQDRGRHHCGQEPDALGAHLCRRLWRQPANDAEGQPRSHGPGRRRA